MTRGPVPAANAGHAGDDLRLAGRGPDLPRRVHLDIELQVGLGEVLVVLGGPGSGKSLLVGAIAGLVRADAGRVSLDGRVFSDG